MRGNGLQKSRSEICTVCSVYSTAVWLENKHGKTNKTTWLCMKNNNLKKNHSMEQQITTTRIKKKKNHGQNCDQSDKLRSLNAVRLVCDSCQSHSPGL